MGDGDSVTQQQFFDTMNTTRKEILDAIEAVNGNVRTVDGKATQNVTAIAVMTERLKKLDEHDQDIRTLKRVDRLANVISNGIGIAALGLAAWVRSKLGME